MFNKISTKQVISYTWWRIPKFKDYKMFVAHGAIRTGKTIFTAWGFFDWAESVVINTPRSNYTQGWNKFNIIAATKYTADDNVVDPMMKYAAGRRSYVEVEYRALMPRFRKSVYNDKISGTLIFKNEKTYFTFKYLGANNKRSVMSIQGSTRRGTFIDEAALIDPDLIELAIGRNITFPDHKIFMTCNPEGDDSHTFYQQYIKGGTSKSILVVQFELLDNPLFTITDVDRMSRIFTPVMYQRKVLGKWVRDSGSIYKKFDPARHVDDFYDTVDEDAYIEMNVGIDYGEVDATVFTLIGIRNKFQGIDVVSTYYHKNSDRSEKDINDYAEDFFDWIVGHFAKFRRIINVYVESASNGVTFYKVLKRRAAELQVTYLRFKLVEKNIRLPKSTSAIKERIDVMNIMLGSEFIKIDTKCKELILAIKKAVYDDKEEVRLDDKSVDIDSLDSLEYSFLSMIPKIVERIEVLRR